MGRRPAAGGGMGDGTETAGVSSVVGTVLMLAITMAVFAGFSYVVLQTYSEDQARLRADLAAVEENGNYLLHHRGGDALTLEQGRILAIVDGTEVEVPMADLAGQTADGLTWRIGESLCLSGPNPPCHFDHGEVGRVYLVYDNAIVLSDSGLFTSGPAVTYVDSHAVTSGLVDDFEAAQQAGDAGAEAELREVYSLGPPGSESATLSGTTTTANSASNPNNALAGTASGDLTDAKAELDSTGDWVQVSGFSVPAAATGITSVTIGFEGSKASTGGPSTPTVLLSYQVSGSTGATTLSQALDLDTDQAFTVTVTADDPTWAIADITNLAVRVEATGVTNRNAAIDHLYVTIEYSTAPVLAYNLDVRTDFADVPLAASHLLEIDYRVSGDTFRVQVWNGAAYVTRGTALTAAGSTSWSYALTAAEFNGGAPSLRFIDAASAAGEGHLWLAHVRLVSS